MISRRVEQWILKVIPELFSRTKFTPSETKRWFWSSEECTRKPWLLETKWGTCYSFFSVFLSPHTVMLWNASVNVTGFCRCLRYDRFFKVTRANHKKHTCGGSRLRLHRLHVAILTAARFALAIFCSGHTLQTGCCSFYLTRRAGILSRDCLLRGLNPDLTPT